MALKAQGHLQAAIDAYHQALAIKPDYAEAYYNLGVALRSQGHLQAAIDNYRQALAIKPDYLQAYANLGVALHNQGHLQVTIDVCRQALAIKPDYPDAHSNLSLAQLLLGDYKNGWEEYEWRFKTTKPQLPVTLPQPQVEQWNGHNHAIGEPLMLVSEQGLGDTLQFIRYMHSI